jgi:hypothetical protein
VSVVATGVEIKTPSLTASAPQRGSVDVHEAFLAELSRLPKAERNMGGAEMPEVLERRADYRS